MIVEIVLGYWFVLWFAFCLAVTFVLSAAFCLWLLLLFVVKRVSMVWRGEIE